DVCSSDLKVVQDQQGTAFYFLDQPEISSVQAGCSEQFHELGGVEVHGFAQHGAGMISNGLCQVAFSDTGGPGDDNILILFYEVSREEPFKLVSVQISLGSIVNISNGSLELKTGAGDCIFDSFVLP